MPKVSIYKQNSQAYINILSELRKNYNNLNDTLEKKLIYDTVSNVLRQKSIYETPKYISDNARDLLISLESNRIEKHGDIHSVNKKSKIILDHCNPINTLVDRILNKGEDIDKVMCDHFTAILTKHENQTLTQNKFKNERPNGWQDAYHKCGIVWNLY